MGLGPHKAVVIGDYGTLKDLFKHDVVNDRPAMFQWINKYFRHGNGKDSRGLIFRFVRRQYKLHLKVYNWGLSVY